MISSNMFLLISVILFIFTPETCVSEVPPSSLFLYSPGFVEFTDVIIKRVGDNLTLVCELRGDAPPLGLFVWNYLPANESAGGDSIPYTVTSNGSSSSLFRPYLSESDSGRYVCAAPPHSQAKYVKVQQPGGQLCAPSALRCGKRCVLATNVCDGHPDCIYGEDEAVSLCGPSPCDRPDRLNCSLGRCIPLAACCPTPHPLCRQHSCCTALHTRAPLDLEMIPPFEDRRAPDDYGFIQSTIYTVTACALIFMIAVVLLVSAICKMHMKRAALRSYTHPEHRYSLNLGVQRHRFPPCYEAADLLEQAVHDSPGSNDNRCIEEVSPSSPARSECGGARLAALAGVFGYRQVPTSCAEVEMLPVTSTGPSSPARPGAGEPHDRHRLTLQLGRFHLSIPSFRREPRPDTPNVAEINIDDLDFVRLNTNETYTLNGRTIRLFNGNFDNIPVLNNPPPYNEAMRYKFPGPPPEYLSRDRLNRSSSEENARSNIEMPPGYEELGVNVVLADEATNIPSSSFYCANIGNGNCSGLVYASNNSTPDDSNIGNVAGNIGNTAGSIGNATGIVGNATESTGNTVVNTGNAVCNTGNAACNTGNAAGNTGNQAGNTGNAAANAGNAASNTGNQAGDIGNEAGNIGNETENIGNEISEEEPLLNITRVPEIVGHTPTNTENVTNISSNNEISNNNNATDVAEQNNNETLNSVIDNLPAIDSDVNANGEIVDNYAIA